MRIINADIDDRDNCPLDQEKGVYVVVKKNVIARFTFGKRTSSFEDIESAFNAMRSWLDRRQDADTLRISLLLTHF